MCGLDTHDCVSDSLNGCQSRVWVDGSGGNGSRRLFAGLVPFDMPLCDPAQAPSLVYCSPITLFYGSVTSWWHVDKVEAGHIAFKSRF